jgi:hypothetical protein
MDMFKFKIDNINNRINDRLLKRYQIEINSILKKIDLKLLEGSEMMG